MSSPSRVRLDLNNLEFQQQLFDLEKVEHLKLLSLHPDHDSAYRDHSR